jgi:hypothetical protein
MTMARPYIATLASIADAASLLNLSRTVRLRT